MNNEGPNLDDLKDDPVMYSHLATQAIHCGNDPTRWYAWPIVPPVSLSVTFKQPDPGNPVKFDYSRVGNPTREQLETAIAALDGNKYACCFSSGCAALCGICYLLNAGDHVICGDDVYGGTNRFFNHLLKKHGFKVDFVDATNTDNLTAALKPNTKLVWLETPTNPTLKMTDLENTVKAVKAQAADALIAVDNTFMSPCFQRPSDYGVDMVVHSITKYINGHTDVVMGSISTSNKQLADKLLFILKTFGGVPSPFDCFLVIRSIKTLPLRMKQHMKNGLAVARYLVTHPAVESVIHPGLSSHPQYKLGLRQLRGYSGMLSFYIKGGLEEAKLFLKSLKMFALAESLGGYESLAELPSVMTHLSVDSETRQQLGVTDNLVRLSVGLEDIDDLLADLDQALRTAVPK